MRTAYAFLLTGVLFCAMAAFWAVGVQGSLGVVALWAVLGCSFLALAARAASRDGRGC